MEVRAGQFMKTISTKIPGPAWQALFKEANSRGVTLADLLREILMEMADKLESVPREEEWVPPAKPIQTRVYRVKHGPSRRHLRED